ncbi:MULTISPECIES: hypothetical protein [unclassified Microcoleus]|uniref:hypothetical protein n=1 Tax=unclassified Microcoleus TaxID=2642155 RepID=UPI001D56DF47|nr:MULTISPECIES: hypothetical protein [unclassified Microcoleus]MCC3448823.1 hypothetical protein [Microcoleus sp. PH2017_09_SFU_O_A]MCC3629810.1 hypothetical protein [Microcoleus sp. PH2017_39_LGB_O_B]MCC3565941.1 hypothetical protein [Microcoleus sp. PH2017_31_RDM_U_A]MCC3578265.1 hypothetical protein [Microcoleus sp. PH2017_32_RDM_D_A]MCC3616220.1 hypothetical protein [Microcoleus sp. PH2017_38_RDM_U_B]
MSKLHSQLSNFGAQCRIEETWFFSQVSHCHHNSSVSPNFITHSNSTINLIMNVFRCDRLNQLLKRISPTSDRLR